MTSTILQYLKRYAKIYPGDEEVKAEDKGFVYNDQTTDGKMVKFIAWKLGVIRADEKEFVDFPKSLDEVLYHVFQLYAKKGASQIVDKAEVLTRFVPTKTSNGQSLAYLPYSVYGQIDAFDREGYGKTKSLGKELLRYQLKRLCRELSDEIEKGALPNDYAVTLNVSPALFDIELVKYYYQTIKECRGKDGKRYISAKNIGIEFTETSKAPSNRDIEMAGNDGSVKAKRLKARRSAIQKGMDWLQARGTLFYLDDFNAGLSTEDVLQTYHFDGLKFDLDKFKELIDQLYEEKQNAPGGKVEPFKLAMLMSGGDDAARNVLEHAMAAILSKPKELRPKKIIFEGLRDGKDKDGKTDENEEQKYKQAHELIMGKYKCALKELGYNESNIFYQGYLINYPCKIGEIVAKLPRRTATKRETRTLI